jgi:hypothetical protein
MFGHTGDDVIAGIDQRLAGQDDRLHARTGDGDPVRRAVDAVERAGIARDRLPQLRDAALPRVERLARMHRALGRIADEARRRQVALAEPQRNDVGIATPDGRDIADPRGRDVSDPGADRRLRAGQERTRRQHQKISLCQ